MATITILLLLCAVFILCESTPLMEANLDQLSASEPILKTNGELLPDVKEIIDEGNSTGQSPDPKIFAEINPVQALTLAQGDTNDLETLHPPEELDEVQALYLKSVQGTDERVGGTKGRSSCPSGWSDYRSRCFRFINTERTWAESEQFCVLEGGNLASIHSREEYYFIQNLVSIQTGGFPRTWIGGYDLAQEGLWLWSDGSRFVFSYWGQGQPDNFKGQQNCLSFNFGAQKLWDDTCCNTHFPSICSKGM